MSKFAFKSQILIILKKLLFFVPIFCALTTNAQNYLLTFTGTGESTTVDNVKVENLTAGTSLTVNGDDILNLTFLTGINSVENKQSPEIKIYPNPMTDNAILQIYPPVAGMAVISIFDMTGKMVSQIKSYLDNSLQEFRLSGINNGFYSISIDGSTYHYSGKLICVSKTEGLISIDKITNNQITGEKADNIDFKGVQTTVDMEYTNGDRLKFTGISGNYSTVITDIPNADKTITFNFIACTDEDSNNYPIIQIGTQIWMVENLKTIKYSNGDLIGTTTPSTLNVYNEISPKYQWAPFDIEGFVAIFGRLYTWYAATDSRNVCPTGWHVPFDDEWTKLTDYLINEGYGYEGSGDDIAKSLAATIYWPITLDSVPGTPSHDHSYNNSSGFTALPSGARWGWGDLETPDSFTRWWSASEDSGIEAWYRGISYDLSIMGRAHLSGNKSNGFSIRCLKD